MDESSLPDIAQLLSGSIGPSTRAATCTAIAACSAGESGASLRKSIGTSTIGETIIRRLLTLCADSNCARVALSALVNLSEDEASASVITRAGAVERCTKALLNPEQQSLASLYAGLLSNLTRFPSAVSSLVGKGMGETASRLAVDRLFQLVAKIETIPNALWLSNACSTVEGRATLLIKRKESSDVDVEKQPITWLLRLLSHEKHDVRLAAASAMRNCAMAEDCHPLLVNETNAIGVCVARFMSPIKPVLLANVKNAPSEVRDIAMNPQNAKPEELIEIRLMLSEALLLLCKTLLGRQTLRQQDVYYVLEEWLKIEDNNEVHHSIDNVMDRLAAAEVEEEIDPDSITNGISMAKPIQNE